ncbi:MAG TPA: hypothetical protein VGL56_05390 [Fimbriimonadaceae bacterium]|jgi:hypothetical protein
MNTSKTTLIIAIASAATAALAQNPPVNDPLLDHLAGKWVMSGMLAGKNTTHELEAKWVIEHHYLQLHEVSRDKDAKGQPQYEANVFIGWNTEEKEYGCVWMDVFGGLSPLSLGAGKPAESQIPILFKNPKSTFHTTFAYNPKDNTWTLNMDEEDNGKFIPFGRMVLKKT